jgi:hypothetical protein
MFGGETAAPAPSQQPAPAAPVAQVRITRMCLTAPSGPTETPRTPALPTYKQMTHSCVQQDQPPQQSQPPRDGNGAGAAGGGAPGTADRPFDVFDVLATLQGAGFNAFVTSLIMTPPESQPKATSAPPSRQGSQVEPQQLHTAALPRCD